MSLEKGSWDGRWFRNTGDNNRYSDNRELYLSSPGSESMACGESRGVNVGGPNFFSREGVSTDKYKSEGVEIEIRKSDDAYYH